MLNFTVAVPFPSGACGSLRDRHARLRPGISSSLGGFATSRSPLAAVAARGAEDNINDDDVAACDVILELQCLSLASLLLRATDTPCSAIRDLETFLYSPLRGNILGRAFLSHFSAGTGEIVSEQVGHNFVGTIYKHL